VLECDKQPLPVARQALLICGFGAVDVAADAAGVEQLLREVSHKAPDETIAVEQGGELMALKAERAGQSEVPRPFTASAEQMDHLDQQQCTEDDGQQHEPAALPLLANHYLLELQAQIVPRLLGQSLG